MSALAILCSGQGGQHPGMFERVAGDAAAAGVFAAAAAALGEEPRAVARRGGAALFENRVAQPLVCATALATWAALAPRLPAPRLFAGYSVGELAAYGCAGAAEAATILRLAAARAACMDAASAVPGGLLAVRGLERAGVDALCAGHGAAVAIVNGPQHFVLGAPRAALDALERAARAAGATLVRRLPVAVAAHTPALGAARAAFAAELAAAGLRDPAVPVLAGVSAAAVTTRAAAIAALSDQLAQPIDWRACLHAAWERGARVFLELGPGTALARLVREALPQAEARAVDEFRGLDGVAEWVAGALAK